MTSDASGRYGRGERGGARSRGRLRRAVGALLLLAALLAPLPGPGAAGSTAALAQPAARGVADDEPPPFGAPSRSLEQADACAGAASCTERTETDSATGQPADALQVAGGPAQTTDPTGAASASDQATASAGAETANAAAAPAPAAAPSSQPASAPGATNTLQQCPAGPALLDTLRTRWDAGTLVLSVQQSALASLAPGPDALRALTARLRDGEPPRTDDALGWLLTRREAPRYPDNPFVTLTRDQSHGEAGDASYEALLAARVAASDEALQPPDVLRLALDVTGGDYPLATLVAHNLLKELAFASRDGADALVGWSAGDRGSADAARAASDPRYTVRTAAEVPALVGKLAALRPADDPRADDRLGPWYHLFGMLFVGALVGGPTPFGPEADLLAAWFQPDPAPDAYQDQVTACGTRLAALVAALAAPAEAAAPSAAAPAAPPSAPPATRAADPAGALAAPFAAPGAVAGPTSGASAAPSPAVGPSSAAAPAANSPAAPAANTAAAPAPPAVLSAPFAAPVIGPLAAAPIAYYPTPFPAQPAPVVPAQALPPTPVPAAVVSAPSITGLVRNAQSGQPLAGATVSVTGTGAAATTDAGGNYQLAGLTPGVVQVSVTATGYIGDSASVTVPPTGSATQNFALSQSLAAGQFRIVLTWGSTPRDLDAVLYLPGGGATNKVDAYTRSAAGASLDTDARNGAGPETITITQASPGQYTYAVHQYSNDGTLAASGAHVQVLRGSSTLQSFDVPSGVGRWWTVFTFDGTSGTITPVNTMSSQPPSR
ncbi:MAG TPA: carboxypeptidase regulatory-like domain-containing protein [Chloroflexota bacterium]|nr:carboxypeptidase regulatory-like domain-containing protein [Chloroflexota bacterium]